MTCKTIVVQTLDVRGLRCPLPLLKVKQALTGVAIGQSIEVWATDSGALRDIPAFIKLTAHRLHKYETIEAEYYFLIEKGQ